MTDVESTGYVRESDGSEQTTARKSMTFFGVCDFRIATLFVNGLNLSMIFVGLFWKALFGSFIVGLPGIILSALGIYGAKTFELWAMYLASAGFLVALILDGILMNWLGLVITAIVLVPHVILTFEIRNGIMTKETYENEEFLIPAASQLVDKTSSYMAPTTTSSTAQE
ncbi:MAG: hypothetical protein SGARI_003254 [Bacillariaceae sp.]